MSVRPTVTKYGPCVWGPYCVQAPVVVAPLAIVEHSGFDPPVNYNNAAATSRIHDHVETRRAHRAAFTRLVVHQADNITFKPWELLGFVFFKTERHNTEDFGEYCAFPLPLCLGQVIETIGRGNTPNTKAVVEYFYSTSYGGTWNRWMNGASAHRVTLQHNAAAVKLVGFTGANSTRPARVAVGREALKIDHPTKLQLKELEVWTPPSGGVEQYISRYSQFDNATTTKNTLARESAPDAQWGVCFKELLVHPGARRARPSSGAGPSGLGGGASGLAGGASGGGLAEGTEDPGEFLDTCPAGTLTEECISQYPDPAGNLYGDSMGVESAEAKEMEAALEEDDDLEETDDSDYDRRPRRAEPQQAVDDPRTARENLQREAARKGRGKAVTLSNLTHTHRNTRA